MNQEQNFVNEDQLRDLQDENARLCKLLAEKEVEMKNTLKKVDQEITNLSGISNLNGDAAAAKIIELSKKIREQNCEIGSIKVKMLNFQNKCHVLEKKLKEKFEGFLNDQNSENELMEENKILKDKLKTTESRLADTRNTVTSLKSESKLLNKLLSQEVGDQFSISELVANPSSFKGRNQQISYLQKKVSDLKKQIEDHFKTKKEISNGEENSNNSNNDSFLNYNDNNPLPKGINYDERQKERIKSIENSRKEQIDKLTIELKTLEANHNSLKSKHEATKARNQVLASELKSLRLQTATLNEKGKHDDELIEALLKQQQQLKDAYLEEIKNIQAKSSNKEDKIKIESLMKEIEEKSEKIKILETNLKQMGLNTKKQNSFGDSNQNANNNSENDGKENNPTDNIDKDNATIMLEFENGKLEELLHILESRNQMMTKKLTDFECGMKELQKKNVHLVKQLDKMKEDKKGKSNIVPANDETVQQLKLKVENLESEKDVWKASLENCLKTKENDLLQYKSMVKQMKNIRLKSKSPH